MMKMYLPCCNGFFFVMMSRNTRETTFLVTYFNILVQDF